MTNLVEYYVLLIQHKINLSMSKTSKLKKGIHYFIILFFLVELIYLSYVIFVVLQPEFGGVTLSENASRVDLDLLTKRRLYAIEFWVAFSGFAIYLSLTEFKKLWD